MRLKITVNRDAVPKLVAVAVAERRPINLQAEILLRRALGLPDVVGDPTPKEHPAEREEAAAHV